MDEYELQFDVFETNLDGSLKPIFMVGKCPPPERDQLRNSIKQVINQEIKRDSNEKKNYSPNNTIDEEIDEV
jgi:hypothetical protein